MSGHSKWSQIKRKKAVVDAKRGKVFTKLIKEITVSSRLGGGDEDINPRLRHAIIVAKGANMPADNIKKAIQRGTGELPGITYEEAIFEGYGPGGAAIMIEIMTDNRNRTVAELRHLMTKYGGNLGEAGCVSWIFDKRGLIVVDKEGTEEDALLEIVLEGGGDDLVEEDDAFEITSSPEYLLPVREILNQKGFHIRNAEVVMIPNNIVRVEGEDGVKLLRLMNALEDHDDVQNIFSNFDVNEAILTEVS